MTDVKIRRMERGDLRQAARLEETCFAAPWSERSLADMLESPRTLYLVAECDGIVVGYCGTQMVLDEGDILRIAVHEKYRGQRIGSALLEYLWEHTGEIMVWNLDVRAGNAAAIALYNKYNFLSVGRRKNYYRNPTEDAVLMQRKECVRKELGIENA